MKNKFELTYYNTNGFPFKILEYNGWYNVIVQFLQTGTIKTVGMAHVKRGEIKDPHAPTVWGVGIPGDKYPIKLENKSKTKEYSVWSGVLQRCYSEDFHQKSPVYKDCTVSENFKYYEYFYEWYNAQIGSDNEGWELDKDILIKGNKLYSEHTCCFVPREINSVFGRAKATRGIYPIGVYKTRNGKFSGNVEVGGVRKFKGGLLSIEDAFLFYKHHKEEYIKTLAKKYKDSLDPRVYESLINWEIQITD